MKFWTDEPPIPDHITLLSRRTWNGGKGEDCRVVIADGRIQTWTANGQRVIPTDDAEVVDLARNGRGWTVTTPEGVWDVAMGGCGCGSPLRHFSPEVADVQG